MEKRNYSIIVGKLTANNNNAATQYFRSYSTIQLMVAGWDGIMCNFTAQIAQLADIEI
jgi:hypothetical protein